MTTLSPLDRVLVVMLCLAVAGQVSLLYRCIVKDTVSTVETGALYGVSLVMLTLVGSMVYRFYRRDWT